MISCVLGLTACGSKQVMSEFQQSKVLEAESLSNSVISLMEAIAENGGSEELLENYNNVELADWFAYNMSQYTGSTFVCSGKGVRSGIDSFVSGLDSLGGFVEVGAPTSVVDDDQIIVTVPVTGINGQANVELIFSNDILGL